MKNILLGLTLFAGLMVLQNVTLLAQSFELLTPTTIPELVKGEKEDFELTSSPEIKNVSDDTIKFIMTITPTSLAEGHRYYYCDMENCYSGLPGESGFVIERITPPFPIPADSTTSNKLHIYLLVNGIEGVSTFNISFTNADNPLDQLSYQVTFNVGTVDVNEPQVFSFNIADVVPNPAIDYVTINFNEINYDLNKVNIYNLNGQLIEQININNINENVSVNTAKYPNGYYIYNLLSDSKVLKIGNFIVYK